MVQAGSLFSAGHYREAGDVFSSVLETARRSGLTNVAGRALGNWGGCEFALHQYRAALQSFLEAQRLSESAGEPAVAAGWEANIASLYSEMGEYDAAAAWTERSIRRMSGRNRARHLPKLQIQLATLRARQGRLSDAIDLFQHGIHGADDAGDLPLYAIGWNRLGEELLKQGELAGAEGALLEAFRVRKLHHLPLNSSYHNLGLLRLEQKDLVSASNLLDRAVELAGNGSGLIPAWEVFHTRGRIRLAQGRLAEALEDLRIARRLGSAWRWSAPADDTARVGAEGMLEPVYSAYVDAGNRLYQENHDPALARETFEAEEENRAASLRALLSDPKRARPDLPERYWAALDTLQSAELDALRRGASEGVSTARAEWIRVESSLGSGLTSVPVHLLAGVQRALGPQTVLLSFHLGDSVSWLWALDRAGLELYELPPRHIILPQADRATKAIREDLPEAPAEAAKLYGLLFGGLPARFERAPRWLLALDDKLFDVPVSALVSERNGRAVYVAEQHAIDLIPGAAFWLESARRPAAPASGLFLGVGDPIYNYADERAAHRGRGSGDAIVLPRLVGSGEEIEACARTWKGPSALLRGADASREKLLPQLSGGPAVVHLATHYLASATSSGYGLIALSLTPSGSTEILTPYEISHWNVHTGLVVLSGCHSAAGAALPGTGVMGLGRAWLAAGAQAVLGTLWETTDDGGALFRPMYRSLQSSETMDAPGALHRAQLEMIRSGGRWARPAYWGAYFVVGAPGKMSVPQ